MTYNVLSGTLNPTHSLSVINYDGRTKLAIPATVDAGASISTDGANEP